jgi:hypothetical protein
MLLQPVIQIHDLLNWRIKSGQELIANNEKFQRIFRVIECLF